VRSRKTRPISWIKSARKAFESFPRGAQDEIMTALTMAAEGEKADIAKPLKGLGSGVFEIALKHRSHAYRTVYALQVGEDLWVIHAFKKKSTRGIETPQKEIERVRERLKRLKREME
jgi:phage-related protein